MKKKLHLHVKELKMKLQMIWEGRTAADTIDVIWRCCYTTAKD